MKCELFNGVTYYTDGDVCTDIDVTPDIKSLTTPRGKPAGVPMIAFYQHPYTTRALG